MSDPPAEFVRFACRRCQARVKAPASAVGRKLLCPVCQLQLVVPTLEDVARERARIRELGAYSAAAEYSPGEEAEGPRYISLVCPLCRSQLYARPDQIGRQIQCADCDKVVTVVAPREEPVQPPAPPSRDDVYAVCDWDWESPPAATETRRYVPVVCKLCHTRMHATIDQVGQSLVCPDCGTATKVRRPPPAPPPPPVNVHNEYAVGRPVESPPLRLARFYQSPVAEPGFSVERPKLEPPRWPMLLGVVEVLAYRGVWLRWFALSGVAFLLLELVWLGIYFGEKGGIAWGFCLAVFGMIGLVGFAWFVTAAVTWLAILVDTAGGNDQIEGWPDAIWLDWVGHSMFLVNSLAIVTLLGYGVATGAAALGLSVWPGVAPGVLLFPVLLLAMLETGSMFDPFSRPVWSSLWYALGPWLLFYVESSLLLAAAGGLAALLIFLGNTLTYAGAALIGVAAAIVYFRLLGRLAHVCRARFALDGDDQDPA